jgi:aspartate racemase
MIASNTPHMRLQSIIKGLDFPIVSILDTTAGAVQARGGERALILGTSVTMNSSVYMETLKGYGIETLPRMSKENMAALDHLIDVDLYRGEIGGASERILALCRMSIRDKARDVVCLACTELPLAFPEYRDSAWFKIDDISFVNTTVAHAEAVFHEALG